MDFADEHIGRRDPDLVEFILQQRGLRCSQIKDKPIEVLGKGNFGKVFSIFDTDTNRKIAVKEELVVKKAACNIKDNVYVCNSLISSFPSEVIVNYWFRKHPDPVTEYNIVKSIAMCSIPYSFDPKSITVDLDEVGDDYETTEDDLRGISIFIFMEQEDTTLRKEWVNLSDADKVSISYQLYHVLAYFDRIGLEYPDLTFDNILLRRLTQPLTINYTGGFEINISRYLVKLTDFGVCRIDGLLDFEGLFRKSSFENFVRMLFWKENGALEEPNNFFKAKTVFGAKINSYLVSYLRGQVTKKDFLTALE
jgi:serine/threonine protein kinase